MTPSDLSPYWREQYEERAALIEEGCKVPPDVANERALVDILRRIREGEKQP